MNGNKDITGLLALLLNESPSFHGMKLREDTVGTKNWMIRPEVLEWMCHHIKPGSQTLETGCGYTSVLLSALSSRHTVISPLVREHELIKQWCASHDVATDHVNFMASKSQDVLPGLEVENLDMALIDGDHAFPAPFLDWYYLADKVAVGGLVIVDDTQIRTGEILRDFLKAETDRWQMVEEIGKTSIFRRITEAAVAYGVGWIDQPWCHVERPLIRRVLSRVRRMVQ